MQIKKKYDVIIVGAGLAGIACSIRLRQKGKSVLVIEKAQSYGGKMSETKWKGYRWDKGPSLFTEPALVEELFELCERNINEYFHYENLNESCSYHFADLTSITLKKESEGLIENQNSSINITEKKTLSEYIKKSKELYDNVGDYFISNPIPSYTKLMSISMLKRYRYFIKKPFRSSLNSYNTSYFKNDKIVQILNRFGTYNGSNPYQMSGLYSMISHLELNGGTYAPSGGMRSIVDALYKLSCDIGVQYLFNESLTFEKIKDGYQSIGSKSIQTEILICAMDHVRFYENVLRDKELMIKSKAPERSTSGLIFYWGLNNLTSKLGVHNIFFSADYKQEAESIWEEKKNYSDPTIYINVGSKVNPTDAPENCENWFVMVNTPAGVPSTKEYRKFIRKNVINRIKATLNVDITDKIEHEEYWDSTGIESDTGSYLGAIYGSSSNKMTASLKRHRNKSKKYDNLYFCGGTVHPGGGIPLVLRSAKIVDSYIQ